MSKPKSSVLGVLLLLIFIRRSVVTALIGLTGVYLLQRGMTGHGWVYHLLGLNRTVEDQSAGCFPQRAVTSNKPVEDLYRFWRNLENLPRFRPPRRPVAQVGQPGAVEGPTNQVTELPTPPNAQENSYGIFDPQRDITPG